MKFSSLFLSLLALSCILNSCGENAKPQEEAKYVSYIQGLASPIALKFDSTEVLLTDYFPDISGVEDVDIEGQNLTIDKATGKVIITTKPASRVSALSIQYKGVMHDIPVFASDKVKYHFTYKATNDNVAVVEISGSMNGWNRKATPLQKKDNEWSTDLILNSGLYQYRVWEDGKEMMDKGNPNKMDNGMGAFNNTFFAGEKKGSAPQLMSASAKPGVIEIAELSKITNVEVFFENKLIEHVMNGDIIHIHIPEEATKMKRSFIRIYADNGEQRSNDILVPLENGLAIMNPTALQRSDLQTSVMYFAMVDRFVDGDPTNNRPTPDPEILPKANNLGGDLQGITQKIKDGYFKEMGVNTIWISPISKNAEGAWGLWDKGIKSKFSAYHGYWPTALRQIDDRFGNEAQFKELLDVAHQNGMNVILDYVAHHVHQDHPLYKQKPEWTTPLYLPDGTMNSEKWDEYRLTTWFDTFLPTWKFDNHEVVEALTDTALYWVQHYDLDGFRHDATKHINEDFWRTLTKKVKQYKNEHPERNIYQVGETYGNPELISSYINSGELDAQFDFNLYDAAVDAFAKDNTTFENLERVMHESLHYYGSHHVMGNITGNQDRARFISYADGSVQFSEDAKRAGWTRDIENKGQIGYDKLAMLNAFLMTTPGIPCVYYGDEIGMPGGNDPDNRRMMHFGDWNTSQKNLSDITSKLIKLRRTNMALMYGDLFVIHNDADVFVYARSYFGKNAIVVFRKSKGGAIHAPIAIPDALKIQNPQQLGAGEIKYENGTIVFGESKGVQFEVFF